MSVPAQITILIPDPDEMMFVTGDNDANIDRIEREFAVKIVSRGAELRIMGDPANVVGDVALAQRGEPEAAVHVGVHLAARPQEAVREQRDRARRHALEREAGPSQVALERPAQAGQGLAE